MLELHRLAASGGDVGDERRRSVRRRVRRRSPPGRRSSKRTQRPSRCSSRSCRRDPRVRTSWEPLLATVAGIAKQAGQCPGPSGVSRRDSCSQLVHRLGPTPWARVTASRAAGPRPRTRPCSVATLRSTGRLFGDVGDGPRPRRHSRPFGWPAARTTKIRLERAPATTSLQGSDWHAMAPPGSHRRTVRCSLL